MGRKTARDNSGGSTIGKEALIGQAKEHQGKQAKSGWLRKMSEICCENLD